MSNALLTPEIRERLLQNGRLMRQLGGTRYEPDFLPVVKLFLPEAGFAWLLTELDPDEPDIAFGLCDLGIGCPELGYVRLSEIAALRGVLGLRAERDQHFVATKTISAYAEEARRHGGIGASYD
jgi:hypothetical protein